jgi:hypothetical protein
MRSTVDRETDATAGQKGHGSEDDGMYTKVRIKYTVKTNMREREVTDGDTEE